MFSSCCLGKCVRKPACNSRKLCCQHRGPKLLASGLMSIDINPQAGLPPLVSAFGGIQCLHLRGGFACGEECAQSNPPPTTPTSTLPHPHPHTSRIGNTHMHQASTADSSSTHLGLQLRDLPASLLQLPFQGVALSHHRLVLGGRGGAQAGLNVAVVFEG